MRYRVTRRHPGRPQSSTSVNAREIFYTTSLDVRAESDLTACSEFKFLQGGLGYRRFELMSENGGNRFPPTIRAHCRVKGPGFNKIFENSAHIGMRGY